MADITNVQAVAFCNQQIRPMADKLAQAYYQAKEIVNNWNSQGLASVLPPGNSSIVADGSMSDGRHPITADNAYGIILQAQSIITSFEASNQTNLTSILLVAVNVNP